MSLHPRRTHTHSELILLDKLTFIHHLINDVLELSTALCKFDETLIAELELTLPLIRNDVRHTESRDYREIQSSSHHSRA